APYRHHRPVAVRGRLDRVRAAAPAGEGLARHHRPGTPLRVAAARGRVPARTRRRVRRPHRPAPRVGRERGLPLPRGRAAAPAQLRLGGGRDGTRHHRDVLPRPLGRPHPAHAGAVGLHARPEAQLRRRPLRLEDDGRPTRRPAREDGMSWSNGIRRFHRVVSIVFTLTVAANFAAMTQGPPPAWVTYSPLLPLALLLFSGLYLFALPYLARRRGRTP